MISSYLSNWALSFIDIRLAVIFIDTFSYKKTKKA